MSNARIGTGILLKRGNGLSPESFTPIAELRTLTPPGYSRNEVDASNHNAGIEEKLLGMLRTGQASGSVNWLATDPTQSDEDGGMLGDILANEKANWQIVFPDGQGNEDYPRWTFPARVQTFSPQEVGLDAVMVMNFALTVDGEITFQNAP